MCNRGLDIRIVQIPRPPLVICHPNKFYPNCWILGVDRAGPGSRYRNSSDTETQKFSNVVKNSKMAFFSPSKQTKEVQQRFLSSPYSYPQKFLYQNSKKFLTLFGYPDPFDKKNVKNRKMVNVISI